MQISKGKLDFDRHYSRTVLIKMPFSRKIRDPNMKLKEHILCTLLFSFNTKIRILDPDKENQERSVNLHNMKYVTFVRKSKEYCFFQLSSLALTDLVFLVVYHRFLHFYVCIIQFLYIP